MPRLPASLTREDRRALARERQQPNAASMPTAARQCLYCYGPLTNGAAVCSDACDEGWWQIVPTTDGELWGALAPAD